MRWISLGLAATALFIGACRPPPPPPPAPVAPPVVVYPAPDTVWTAAADRLLAGEGRALRLPRPFTRLEVIGADSASLRVRCALCGDTLSGWIARADVIHLGTPADSIGDATPVGFALALRRAAVARDLVGLYPLMATDFSFSSLGAVGRDLALASWTSENYRTLDRVPELLDRGLSPAGGLWVAPPEYATQSEFRPLRLGIERGRSGRWEWVFLVSGVFEN